MRLVMEKQIQHSIDSQQGREAQQRILQAMPCKRVDTGKEEVGRRTSCGFEVRRRVSYFTRKGNRRGKKRYPGLYPGLLALGIHERCTPGLAAEIRLLAGMLGSLEEAREVLAERGVDLNIKTLRRIAYRFAERARAAQRVMELDFGPGVAGRRVAIRADGGERAYGRTSAARRRPRDAGVSEAPGASRSYLSSTWWMPRESWIEVSCRYSMR